jgi:hypothetical protein
VVPNFNRDPKIVTKSRENHLTSGSVMSKLERCSSIIGALLIAVAAYIVAADRRRMEEQKRRSAPPIEELSEKLKQAWAGRHIA